MPSQFKHFADVPERIVFSLANPEGGENKEAHVLSMVLVTNNLMRANKLLD